MRKISLLLVLLSIFQFGSEIEDSEQMKKGLNGYKKTINELQVTLALDEKQVEDLWKIFSASNSQKKIDIDLFRSSCTAMIRAAERRREINDSRINDILEDHQKVSFESYKKARAKKKELFHLKEGLLLTEKQGIQVELIISENKDVLKKLYKRLDYYIKSGQDRKKKSSESGRLLRSRSEGLERRNPEVVKMEQGPPEKIRGIRSEKAKIIRKHLNEDQKILYKEYLKFEDQLLNLYIKKLRK